MYCVDLQQKKLHNVVSFRNIAPHQQPVADSLLGFQMVAYHGLDWTDGRTNNCIKSKDKSGSGKAAKRVSVSCKNAVWNDMTMTHSGIRKYNSIISEQ